MPSIEPCAKCGIPRRRYNSAYCRDCVTVAGQCIIPGCDGRIASWSKTGTCGGHPAHLRRKMDRRKSYD